MLLALALTASACKKESAPRKEAPPPEPTAPTEGAGGAGVGQTEAQASQPGPGGVTGRKIKIAFSAPSADHGWTGAISVKAKEQAARYDDVEFSLTQASNAADQVNQINSIISQKPDVLVILPHDDTVTPAALAAMKAGI
ncbi:MAG TPA: substrate-binding domain-containing protein, partial [Kofleriaceae bacterium]|nr:substrate-binding domain-containing protein [Kofleriaceae bacterium]